MMSSQQSTMSPVRRGLTSKISEPDASTRQEMLEIAATMDDVISMGPGDPDLPTPAHIVEAAKVALDAGATHYTPPPGDPNLRAVIARNISEFRDVSYDPSSEVMVTTGAEEAIYMSMATLVDDGDEVLVPHHRFTTYDWGAELAGGKVVPYATVHDHDEYRLDVDEIKRHLTDRSKIIVVVSPDNPTGGVAAQEEIKAVADLAKERDLIVVTDEIYHHFVYDNRTHYSILSEPDMKERTILIDGFSKCYAMTGWRVGFMAGPADYIRSIIEVKHALSICAPAISQAAALAALEGPQDCIAEARAIYDDRRHGLLAALTDMGLTFVYPAGAFYVYTNVSSTGMPVEQFVKQLLRDTGIMISPGNIFGVDDCDYIRMSVLVPKDRILEATNRMERVIGRYQMA